MPPLPPGGHPEPPEHLTPFQRDVVTVVAGLVPGEVLTYAEVALEAGRPGTAQAVANVLRRVPGLPWWRVVPSTGRLYRTHAPTQAPLLAAEGVRVDDDRRVLGHLGSDDHRS
jgi:methylated-DNA-protein-cysteine methyltransferase related protein